MFSWKFLPGRTQRERQAVTEAEEIMSEASTGASVDADTMRAVVRGLREQSEDEFASENPIQQDIDRVIGRWRANHNGLYGGSSYL